MNTGCVGVVVDFDDDKQVASLERVLKVSPSGSGNWLDISRAYQSWVRKNDPKALPIELALPDIRNCKAFFVVTEFCDEPMLMFAASMDDMENLLGLADAPEDAEARPAPRQTSIVARARRITRHIQESRPHVVSCGGVRVNERSYMAYAHGKKLNLTPVEFRLLSNFLHYPNQLFSRDQLLSVMHGECHEAADRSVDAHIKNLRRKLERSGAHDLAIRAVYGVGYRLECR